MRTTTLRVDWTIRPSPLRQPWQHCVGSGHATLALRADWQAQLQRAHHELGFRHVRFHGILDDDMGTLVMQNGAVLYSFFNTDRIFDFLVSIGMRPIVELSFMPRMLSSGNDIVFRYQGNVTPPRDVAQWGDLVRRLAQHWVDRYGIDEVAQWPFECWNEPNLSAFWKGDQAAYFELYRATASALKGVDPRLQVGGPATAGNGWLDDFVGFCDSASLPVDFLSTHYYPTDAFGAVDTDTLSQLADAPRDVMRQRALQARGAAGARPLYYTEWNITSNPRDDLHDTAFAAALAARIVMGVDDVVDAYSWWTFSDLFEENDFPSRPYHGGFGLMNLYGVPKPVYRGLQMLRALGDEQFAVQGAESVSRNLVAWAGRPASADAVELGVVIVNQAMPRHPVAEESVRVELKLPPGRQAARVEIARVDDGHTDPRAAWQALGAPAYPSPAQVAQLEAASVPRYEALAFEAVAGGVAVELRAAAQSIQHLRFRWQRP